MKAYLKNYRQSPRKVRLIAGLVRGKGVDEALIQLTFLAKRGADPIKKLLLSAVANAKQMGLEKENLFIKEIRVDSGFIIKRMMPAAMGTGHRINKRNSHVLLVLAEKNSIDAKKSKKAKKADRKAEKIAKKDLEKKVVKKEVVKEVKVKKVAAPKKASKKVK